MNPTAWPLIPDDVSPPYTIPFEMDNPNAVLTPTGLLSIDHVCFSGPNWSSLFDDHGFDPNQLVARIKDFYPYGVGGELAHGVVRNGAGLVLLRSMLETAVDQGAVAIFGVTDQDVMHAFTLKHGFSEPNFNYGALMANYALLPHEIPGDAKGYSSSSSSSSSGSGSSIPRTVP